MCDFLQSPVTYSLLGRDIFLSSLFSNTFGIYLPLMWDTKFHTQIKSQVKI
jgi:hypothetical protein